MTVSELVATYFNEERLKESQVRRLLTRLVDYWATEKDYELKHELLKQLILRYAALERELVELNRLKNRFLGLAAHDLRNPLVSIRGLAEILLCDDCQPLTDMQREFLSTIHSASDGMLTLVNDILDMAVIESGKIKLQVRPGSLRCLIEERMRVNRVLAEKKRIGLEEDLNDLPPLPFDWNRIAQVIDNLVGNAIKFSPFDSNVVVSLTRVNGTAVVCVRDRGPGISQEDQARVFDEFERLSNCPTGGEKSTGLGLSIARQIVEAHRGMMTIESEVGTGTLFSFTLPMEE
jgi:two-component system, sensor histidine kinase and response regulator